jgi:hypothetical protein
MEKSMQEIERDRRRQAHKDHFAGAGRYIFENNTSGDFQLEKPAMNGAKWLRKDARFTGDSFFLKFVPKELKLISVLVDANAQTVNESTDSKLILDQPDTVTQSGKVEHVSTSEEDAQLNDSTENKDEHKMLLNEDPMDGIDIIID